MRDPSPIRRRRRRPPLSPAAASLAERTRKVQAMFPAGRPRKLRARRLPY